MQAWVDAELQGLSTVVLAKGVRHYLGEHAEFLMRWARSQAMVEVCRSCGPCVCCVSCATTC